MPRPTFTASDVARYTFCNLAWAYDVTGVRVISPLEVQQAKRALLAQKSLTPVEQRDLEYLKQMEHQYTRRDQGEKYHDKLAGMALGAPRLRRKVFIRVFVIVAAVLLLALLFLR